MDMASLSVADLLHLPTLASARLLSESSTALTKRVSGVSVIEVPVEGFVRSGELVLSTAMGIGHDPKLVTKFVQDIATAGASVLAFSTGPYLKTIPPKIIKVAETLQLALLELPWELRFSDIIEGVLRRVLEEQLEARRRDEFIWSLASGSLAAEEILSQAKQHGYDLNRPHCAVVGQIRAETLEASAWLVQQVQQLAVQHKLSVLCSLLGQQLLLFVPKVSTEELRQFLSETQQLLPTLTIAWGVGEIAASPTALARSYQEAKTACDVGVRLRGQGSITFASDTALDRVLLRISQEPESYRMYQRYLAPLLEYQDGSRVSLVETLQTYFSYQRNVTETAKQLGIHRQTLLYRLEKVEQLLNCSLRESKDVLAIELCLRLGKLEPKSES
jgi:DNA-binding PucR family transcriptional regulator